MITKRNTLAALALAAASLMPALSEAHPGAWIDHDRPLPRVERHYARPEHTWAPGHWRGNGHRNIWARDHYVRERHGHHWVPAHPTRYERHREFVPGHWVR